MAKTQVLSPSKLKNPNKLGKDHLKAIITDFSRLATLDKEVAEKTIRYIVDGDDEEVLAKLAGMAEAANAMLLDWNPASGINWGELEAAIVKRANIFYPETDFPPEAWLRLSEAYEAVVRKHKQHISTPTGWPVSVIVGLALRFTSWQRSNYDAKQRRRRPIAELEAILQHAEVPSDFLTWLVLNKNELNSMQGIVSYGYYDFSSLVDSYTGWDKHFITQIDAVRKALSQSPSDHRLHVMNTLIKVKFDYSPVLDLMAEIATDAAKTPRESALAILLDYKDAARPFVEKILAEGNAAKRNEAAQLLWRLFGSDAEETLKKHAESESAARVKQTIEKLLAAPTAESAEESIDFDLPPVEIETGEIELPEEFRKGLSEYFERGYQIAYRNYERELERFNAPNRPQWLVKPKKPPTVAPKSIELLCKFMEGKTDQPKGENRQTLTWYSNLAGPPGDWLSPPGVKLIHVVRLAYALEQLHQQRNRGELWWHDRQALEAYRGRCPEPFGLRELDAAVAALPDGKPGEIAKAYMNLNNRYANFCDWESEAVWPIFAEHEDILRQYFGASPNRHGDYSRWDYYWHDKRRTAFRVLGMFPQLPPQYIPLLWDVALSESKTDRPLAQEALATIPGKSEKILVSLNDGKQGIRAAAAEWLGKIGDPSAIEPLKKAFRKEKQELVKGVMMAALDALGADVNEFLHRKKLSDEAKKGLAKKRPKGMEWVQLEDLPALHWSDTGKAVDPEIVQWWVVQAVQQKSPVPGPIVRRFLSICKRDETAALANFLLSSWIGQDTITVSHEEASKTAKQQSDQQFQHYGTQPWFKEMYGTKEKLYQQLYNNLIMQCLGSAIGQKGMLSLVAAAGDRESAKICERYIRKWFGNRLAQCKALIEVLAWIDDPHAIQILLSIGNRFRTKAIRKAAEEHVQALAERQGWTLDELADRTIPDGGFLRETDEEGKPISAEATLVLDYGPRTFTVRLGDDLQPVITRDDGKTVKAPPAPAKSDDEEKAKAAKKEFSEAKKVIKEVVKRQGERLYEALCIQRTWRFDDWQRYLAWHPVVGKLCCRVVWAALEENKDDQSEKLIGIFRPLEDGSLTNEKDDEVTLAPGAILRLAHTCNAPKELAESWQQHLKDYDVTPLFAQFGREIFTLPEDKKKESDLNDFEGHCLTTFQLRGKATKLGWLRGEAEDGGCFFVYRKPFPSLEMQAVLEFTGSYLPEQDLAAALTTLYFMPIKGDNEAAYSWQPSKMPLGKIPPVLLGEVYNDVKQIAATGSGFDPKWQEKSYF